MTGKTKYKVGSASIYTVFRIIIFFPLYCIRPKLLSMSMVPRVWRSWSPIPAALPLLAHSMIMRHQTTMGIKYFMKSIFLYFCTFFFCKIYPCFLMVSLGFFIWYTIKVIKHTLVLCKGNRDKVSSYKSLFSVRPWTARFFGTRKTCVCSKSCISSYL